MVFVEAVGCTNALPGSADGHATPVLPELEPLELPLPEPEEDDALEPDDELELDVELLDELEPDDEPLDEPALEPLLVLLELDDEDDDVEVEELLVLDEADDEVDEPEFEEPLPLDEVDDEELLLVLVVEELEDVDVAEDDDEPWEPLVEPVAEVCAPVLPDELEVLLPPHAVDARAMARSVTRSCVDMSAIHQTSHRAATAATLAEDGVGPRPHAAGRSR